MTDIRRTNAVAGLRSARRESEEYRRLRIALISNLRLLSQLGARLFDADGQYRGISDDLTELERLLDMMPAPEGQKLARDMETSGTTNVEAVRTAVYALFKRCLHGHHRTLGNLHIEIVLQPTITIACWLEAVTLPFKNMLNIDRPISYHSRSLAAPVTFPPFLYKPLPSPEHWFRLLVLWPSQGKDKPIHCSLAHERLPCKSRYEALSYTWGTSAETRCIWVDGRPLEATCNLYLALEALRKGIREPRVLWVDAVCINQNDTHEKGAQVQLMSTIYQQAWQVVIWLGIESKSARSVWFLLKDYSKHYSKQGTGWLASKPNSITVESHLGQPFHVTQLLRSEYAPVQKLLSRPWFGRAWVLQEVTLAQRAIVQCGTLRFDWDDFCSFVCAYRVQYWSNLRSALNEVSVRERADIDPEERADERMKLTEKMEGLRMLNLPSTIALLRAARARGTSLSITSLLGLVRLQHATDERDKIYAVLGLLDKAQRVAMPIVDYRLSYLKIYITWAQRTILEDGTLDILRMAAAHEDHPWEAECGLPTWVPDWRNLHDSMATLDLPKSPQTTIPSALFAHAVNAQFLDHSVRRMFNASLYDKSPYAFEFYINDRVLCAAGIRLDTLPLVPDSFASQDRPDRDSHARGNSQFASSFVLDWSKRLLSTGIFSHEVFWRVLCRDQCIRYVSLYECVTHRLWKERDSWAGCRYPPNDPKQFNSVCRWTSQEGEPMRIRQIAGHMLRTAKGWCGSFPMGAYEGDEIVILFGHIMPVILRWHGQYYTFIGECYVDGAMDGEIVRAQEAGEYEVEEFLIA
ncbi:cell separation during budding [Elasticomyces elasticus]|nr:cell separation during budding [Elasticomyces elasticus]